MGEEGERACTSISAEEVSCEGVGFRFELFNAERRDQKDLAAGYVTWAMKDEG